MPLLLDLSLRVLAAGLLGAIIGYERELRAKGAGVRTHVLVALGAAMFMVISQFGFEGASRFDAARVAAGVVGGLGFLGGGIIMKSKNHVSGLTTSAGLWVTGSIGLAAGCGMYALSAICVFLVIVCLEALNFYSFKMGEKEVTVVLSAAEQKDIEAAMASLSRQVKDYSLTKEPEGYKAELLMHIPKKDYGAGLLSTLSSFPGVQLESLE